MNAQEGHPDEQRQTAGFLLYYVGRIEGRQPDADIDDLIKAEIPKFDADELGRSGTKCMAGMTRLSARMKSSASEFAVWEKQHPDLAKRVSTIHQ